MSMAPTSRNQVIFRPPAGMPKEDVEALVELARAAYRMRGYPDVEIRVEGPVCRCACACTMPVNDTPPAGEDRCGSCRADDHYDVADSDSGGA